jgi:hypothetical protein
MVSVPFYFTAKFYDPTMRKSEEMCLRGWRLQLLSAASGTSAGPNERDADYAADDIALPNVSE